MHCSALVRSINTCDVSNCVPVDEDGIFNKFYYRKFLELLLCKYLPYYCLWGGIMLHKKGFNVNRVINAPIENYLFCQAQHFKRPKTLKSFRIIRLLREHVILALKKKQV